VDLSSLKPGTRAVIVSIDEGAENNFLLEMGCLPGELVRITGTAPLGDPLMVRVGAYRLSIRKADARHIVVAPETETV
jgi:ferrous iron transport protein A